MLFSGYALQGVAVTAFHQPGHGCGFFREDPLRVIREIRFIPSPIFAVPLPPVFYTLIFDFGF